MQQASLNSRITYRERHRREKSGTFLLIAFGAGLYYLIGTVMESAVFFLVLAPVILFLILWFETKQNRKMNKVLKDTKTMQPLYLMRSVEQKINDLNTKLYGNTQVSTIDNYKGQPQLNEGARQLLTEELNRLTIEFNNNKITLKEYNVKLGQLIQTAEEIKFVNFEQIRSTLS